MSETEKKKKTADRIARNDADSEMELEAGADNSIPENVSADNVDEPETPDLATIEANSIDLPISMDNDPKPEVKINLTPENFKLIITDSAENTTEVIANIDYHAFFIKDKIAGACLDKFGEATEDLWLGDMPRADLGTPPPNSPRIFPPLVERLRNKSPDTKVIFTIKHKTALEQSVRIRQYINILCDRLNLSGRDKDIIACAGYIHTLAKLGLERRSKNQFKLTPDIKVTLLECFNENSVIIKMLRSMYRSLQSINDQSPSLELIGANILTITDLFCDTIPDEEYLDTDTHEVISREMDKLAGKLLLKEVVEAFRAIFGVEPRINGMPQKPFQIIVYSDRVNQIYSFKTRLKNEGMWVMVTDSLESLTSICRRGLPDILVMRINSTPNVVVKAIQHLTEKGIDIGAIPTFLMVKSSIIAQLAPLLKIGIEDILDIETDPDVLVLKIRKIQAHSDQLVRPESVAATQQSGSRGNLCEMNLIDLLQALGPSRRTSRITVKNESAAAEVLTIYLNQGSIIFAELGKLKGEAAIHKALGWTDGTWVVEQISPDNLPEPNNALPNEAILMEGCRLLDENAR